MSREVTDATHIACAQVESPGYRLMPQTMRPDFPGKSGLETEGLDQPGHGVPRQAVRPLGRSVRTNGVQRSIVLLFSPFVKFVEFVAIKIKIGSVSACGQSSGYASLMSEVHRSRRATHPSHDGPIVRNPGRWGFSVNETTRG